jgi:HEAT repeat protein
LLLLVASCAPAPPVRTALQGNLADLKREILNAQQSGKLPNDRVVKLAQAVGERELTSAEGKSGALRVRGLRSCERPLRGAMEQRSTSEDDVAAELTLILLEAHATERTALVNRHTRSPSGAWRAVAARAAVRPVDTDLRKAFYFDPDERVRRAALTTAREVHDSGELEQLLEAARLDPDGQSQSLAARAAGAIGGERAVLALKDLWVRADDTLRIAIVDGWAEKASYAAGGARELATASASAGGLAAVSAAYALGRAGGAEAAIANARLRRYILDGSDDEKRLALSVAPLNPETEAAIVKAAHDGAPELRVVALTRLSSIAERRNDSIRALRDLANAKPASDAELHARDAAISALADAGDTSVSATLIKNLKSAEPQTRWRAAHALASLGDYTNAASALADDDANLRSDLACSILARDAAQR